MSGLLNKCPSCGSTKVSVKRKIGWPLFIFFFISMGLGLLVIPFLPKYGKCKDCGTKWKV